MGLEIERKLSDAGFRMLGENRSIEKLIIEILKTKDNRYLKSIPFLLYKYNPDTIKIYDKTTEKELFMSLINITKKIFFENNIKKDMPELYEKEADKNHLEKMNLAYEEFRDEFDLQLRNEQGQNMFIDKQKIYAERNMQSAMSQIFTKKEKQIIRRIINGKPVSKTDAEYYSRKTKKKLKSIINLQEFAKATVEIKPKYDENLFFLKKSLESWIEKNKKYPEIDIIKYVKWDEKISISFTKKGFGDQIFNTIINLNEVEDKKTIELLKNREYEEHNFT